VRHSLSAVKRRVLEFRRERDWEQFHTPKNLAGSICIEAAELLEHFQWKSGAEKLTAVETKAVAHELADVFIYTLLMANDLKIDLLEATMSKLKENARKYPVAKARGSAKKYTEL
jgi:NTP pyrophosphatase (non-canonical NTP hydrolase)